MEALLLIHVRKGRPVVNRFGWMVLGTSIAAACSGSTTALRAEENYDYVKLSCQAKRSYDEALANANAWPTTTADTALRWCLERAKADYDREVAAATPSSRPPS